LPAAHVTYVEGLTQSADNGKRDTETVALGDRFWLADENHGGAIEVEDIPARAQVELIKRLINLGGRELGLGYGVFDRLLGSSGGNEPESEPPQPTTQVVPQERPRDGRLFPRIPLETIFAQMEQDSRIRNMLPLAAGYPLGAGVLVSSLAEQWADVPGFGGASAYPGENNLQQTSSH
jgi:hypothetical protein